MEIVETPLKGLLLIKPKVFEDDRGYFFESFNKKQFEDAGIPINYVQDNQSLSGADVLRGLHFQAPPYAQAKLVRVIKGAVLDVALDIRKDSPSYGKHFSIELNEQNKWMLYIPTGFAHGFKTLMEQTIFFYKCSELYNKASEGCILWNYANLAIDWNIKNPILSPKDKEGTPFNSFRSPF